MEPRAGYVESADDISARIRSLREKCGLAENFDALTGEGCAAGTGNAYLLLDADAERRTRSAGRSEDAAVVRA